MERIMVKLRMTFPYTKLSAYLLKEQCSDRKKAGIPLNILFLI